MASCIPYQVVLRVVNGLWKSSGAGRMQNQWGTGKCWSHFENRASLGVNLSRGPGGLCCELDIDKLIGESGEFGPDPLRGNYMASGGLSDEMLHAGGAQAG